MTDERDEPSFDLAAGKKPPRRKAAARPANDSPAKPLQAESSEEAEDAPVSQTAATASGHGVGPAAYRVLARKYRPQTFEALIGQEALVRTLANAFASGRIAHAFMLTGVRGVGKTTTARIIARALNCTGPDGSRKEPTITPCGVCDACVSIAESRNVDVQEMDAASRTGIDDIREIIEGVRYSPASARYKVYIIDEVHMLSRQAFNGLLKTLEEPPPHVKFIFATTEIRKVPVTVLSRCQRFDLKRIPALELSAHLGTIAASENIAIDEAALALIARAADGSVRDGLSILDQAIAHADEAEGAPISASALRAMLGLADRARIIDLFEAVMGGRIADALADLASQYDHGAEPLTLMQDLASFCHVLTRARVSPQATAEALASEEEAARALALAGRLSMAALTRAWSLLLKGIEETRDAERPLAAAEMALIRLAYAADLPPVDRLIAAARDGIKSAPAPSPSTSPSSSPVGTSGPSLQAASSGGRARTLAAPERQAAPEAAPRAMAKPETSVAQAAVTFEGFLRWLDEKRESILKRSIERFVHLIAFEPGRISLRLADGAPADLPNQMRVQLIAMTGLTWNPLIEKTGGAPTVEEQRNAARHEKERAAMTLPLVRAVFEAWPKARIIAVRERADLIAPPVMIGEVEAMDPAEAALPVSEEGE